MGFLYDIFIKSSGITTDTRSLVKNKIFFALKGPNFDGNEFAKTALEKGALYAIVDDKKYDGYNRFILVDDVQKSLEHLATEHRDKLSSVVFALTGSNGKTTTKELIASALSKNYNITYSKGNYNNHIGLPLTILSAAPQTEIIIAEMGANHTGEIKHLCNIAQPHYGLITNTGKDHLEGFGSEKAVFKENTELYNYIFNSGKGIIVNADDKKLHHLVSDKAVITYGLKAGTIKGKIIENNPFLCIEWMFEGKKYYQKTKFVGSYNAYNVLAAISTGLLFNVKPEILIEAVANYIPQNNRSQYILSKNNNRIFLDAYNANPTSMNLALDEFLKIFAPPKCVFLGSMKELGKYSEKEHKAILQKLSASETDMVFLVGSEFSKFCFEFPHFNYFENTADLSEYLSMESIYNSSILIKASRSVELENIITYL